MISLKIYFHFFLGNGISFLLLSNDRSIKRRYLKSLMINRVGKYKNLIMKRIKFLIGIMVVVFTLSNCTDNNTDLPEEVITEQTARSSESFNEIISAGEELVYEAPSDYVEENSYLFKEEFKSIETMSVVKYNDFHLLKVNGQNLDEVATIQYYSMDEIVGSGTELSNGGGNGGNYCTSCYRGVLIRYYQVRPDGTFYLLRTECIPCPPGLDHALN